MSEPFFPSSFYSVKNVAKIIKQFWNFVIFFCISRGDSSDCSSFYECGLSPWWISHIQNHLCSPWMQPLAMLHNPFLLNVILWESHTCRQFNLVISASHLPLQLLMGIPHLLPTLSHACSHVFPIMMECIFKQWAKINPLFLTWFLVRYLTSVITTQMSIGVKPLLVVVKDCWIHLASYYDGETFYIKIYNRILGVSAVQSESYSCRGL